MAGRKKEKGIVRPSNMVTTARTSQRLLRRRVALQLVQSSLQAHTYTARLGDELLADVTTMPKKCVSTRYDRAHLTACEGVAIPPSQLPKQMSHISIYLGKKSLPGISIRMAQ